jgi:hypothetical protein
MKSRKKTRNKSLITIGYILSQVVDGFLFHDQFVGFDLLFYLLV